jgi:hypothetical protein
MPVPQIPDELTVNYWQEHKGIIATMAGFTGISQSIREVHAAYDLVDWDLFDARNAEGNGWKLGLQEFDSRFAQARANYSTVVALRDKVIQLRSLAGETAGSFRDAALIPASSRRVVEAIQVAADHFAVELRSMDLIWAHHREHLIQVLTEFRRAIGVLMKEVDLQSGFFQVLPDPPAMELQKVALQKCRAITINIRSQEDMRPLLFDDWNRVAQESFYAVQDGEPVRQKARELRALVATSLLILAQLPG